MVAEELLIREHGLGGKVTGRRQVERADTFILERHDAFAGPKLCDHLGEVARQRAFPAESVDAIGEASGSELFEASHLADARLAGRAHFSAKRLANSLASAS